MIIKTATIDDLPAILHLQKVCYLQEAEIYDTTEIPPLKETIKDLEIAFLQGTIFLKLEEKNEIIGSVRAYETDGTCYIGKLIVHPYCQNKGYGTQLLSSIESLFVNCDRFELFTGHKSSKNLYLYIKLGYREFERVFMHDGLELIFLEKNTLEF